MSSSSTPPTAHFASLFCQHFNIPPERYADTALARTLYPHARVMRPILRAMNSDFFAADRDFLDGVGQLRRPRDFSDEVKDFYHHPANRSFLRRTLRLRVSVGRARHWVDRLLPATTARSAVKIES